MNKFIASFLIISVLAPTYFAYADWIDSLKSAASVVQGFSSVPGLKGSEGTTGSEVPVFNRAIEAIKNKEVGIGTRRIKIPKLGGTNLPFPVPGTSEDSLAWNLANMAIHKLSKEVINWIRTGGRDGKPFFITNWEDFLKDVANEASGQFLEEFELTEICQPFKPRLQLLLGSGGGAYRQRAQCTIRDVAKNMENFYRDFKQGGWTRWFEITLIPQNNFYGSYYMALEERLIRESSALEAQKSMAISGGGFLGKEECVQWETDEEFRKRRDKIYRQTKVTSPIEPVCKKWRTVTPGTLIQDQLNDVFSSDKRRLEVADEIDEIVIAAFQRLFTNLRQSQQGVLKAEKESEDPITKFNRETENEVQRAIQHISNILELPQAISLSQQTADIKQDSTSKTSSLLGILESINSCQQSNNESRTQTSENNIKQLKKDIENINMVTAQLVEGEGQLAQATDTDEVYQLFSDLKAAIDIVISLYDSAVAENNQIAAEITAAEQELTTCQEQPQN